MRIRTSISLLNSHSKTDTLVVCPTDFTLPPGDPCSQQYYYWRLVLYQSVNAFTSLRNLIQVRPKLDTLVINVDRMGFEPMSYAITSDR